MNFCKFTNETRLAMEDASANSGLKFLAALNGICAGGGYELALACDEIVLVDDSNSAVSLPETPLLGVLPGTGGLTRVVDKRQGPARPRRRLRHARRRRQGQARRRVEARRRDASRRASSRRRSSSVRAELAAGSDRPAAGPGVTLGPLGVTGVGRSHRVLVGLAVVRSREARRDDRGAGARRRRSRARCRAILAAGDQFWPLRVFRELDDAILRLRLNEPEIGTIVLKTEGDPARVLQADDVLFEQQATLVRPRGHSLHQADAEAARSVGAQLLRDHRAGQRLRRHAARAGARRGSVVHARRPGAAEHDSAARV